MWTCGRGMALRLPGPAVNRLSARRPRGQRAVGQSVCTFVAAPNTKACGRPTASTETGSESPSPGASKSVGAQGLIDNGLLFAANFAYLPTCFKLSLGYLLLPNTT